MTHIDQRIATIDQKIASGDGDLERLQRRRENLLQRKQNLQNINFEEPPALNNLEILKRQRENIQARLDRINGKITELETPKQLPKKAEPAKKA